MGGSSCRVGGMTPMVTCVVHSHPDPWAGTSVRRGESIQSYKTGIQYSLSHNHAQSPALLRPHAALEQHGQESSEE